MGSVVKSITYLNRLSSPKQKNFLFISDKLSIYAHLRSFTFIYAHLPTFNNIWDNFLAGFVAELLGGLCCGIFDLTIRSIGNTKEPNGHFEMDEIHQRAQSYSNPAAYKRAALPGSRHRNWCFTINNPTSEDRDLLDGLVPLRASYLVFGEEYGEEETFHFQGTVVFVNRHSFKSVKKILPRAHIEQTAQIHPAIAYCKKDGVYYEYGRPPLTSQVFKLNIRDQ